ncbi:OB-fold nucleic acid binding domain protein [Candidatus Tiddalikarchaeum anstoanum]|nr:OB-fold nucleic acid binding domain protein [Candidatus Tiddalikarchaeum anstoanum]
MSTLGESMIEDSHTPYEEGVTETKEIKKRAVAVTRKISQINKETDLRIAVVGSIIDIDMKSLFFTLDDGDKKISVLLNNDDQLKKLKLGEIVRVIGIVMSFDNGFELRGEVVQNFTGLNAEYYNKYLSLLKN